MNDRPLVGGDRMHAAIERRLQVGDGRLAVLVVDRCVLEQHVRLAGVDEFHAAFGSGPGREGVERFAGRGPCQRLFRLDPVRVQRRTMPTGADPHDGPLDGVSLPKLRTLVQPQLKQGSTDVAEAEEGELEVGHIGSPGRP